MRKEKLNVMAEYEKVRGESKEMVNLVVIIVIKMKLT